MMKPLNHAMAAFIAIASASLAHGHGTPIRAEIADGQLVVSQGLSDILGFAPMIYVEGDEDGEPFAEITVPPFGPVVVWQIPGFDIFGMDNDSSLSIEVLRRPVAGSSPVEERTLWYWNDQTELVEPAPAGSALHLLARANQSLTLTPGDIASPPPLLLSDPIAGQQGFHNHSLLSYALDNDPVAPFGAYGFFAHLTSDTYSPSNPFLVVLNHGVFDYARMIPAALAINAASVDLPAAPGDYDTSGRVDAADYAYWRARFGNVVAPFTSPDGNGSGAVDAADYVIWRDAVGQTGAGTIYTAAIPEPGATALSCTALLVAASICRSRRRRTKCRNAARFDNGPQQRYN